MESASTVVKSAINPSNLVKFVLGAVAAFAIFDALGWTNWILFPVTTAKAKFAKKAE